MSTFTTGLCKIEKTVILGWKSHKSKAQSSRVCIKIKKKVIGISSSFILWISKSRNGKFKITLYWFWFFFFTVVLNSIFILTYPGSKVKNRCSCTHDYHCTLFHFQIALYSARKQICYKFVGTAGTYNRTQKFFWSLVFYILSNLPSKNVLSA